MQKLNVTVELFRYDELNPEAREKAFDEHEQFLRENPSTYEDEDENGNIIEKYDNMDDWTLEEVKEYVEDSIRINEYWFFSNGEMADTVCYTGKHEKAGTTELTFLGNTFVLKEDFKK